MVLEESCGLSYRQPEKHQESTRGLWIFRIFCHAKTLRSSGYTECSRRSVAYKGSRCQLPQVGRIEADASDIMTSTVSTQYTSIISFIHYRYLWRTSDAGGRLKFGLRRFQHRGRPLRMMHPVFSDRSSSGSTSRTQIIASQGYCWCLT